MKLPFTPMDCSPNELLHLSVPRQRRRSSKERHRERQPDPRPSEQRSPSPSATRTLRRLRRRIADQRRNAGQKPAGTVRRSASCGSAERARARGLGIPRTRRRRGEAVTSWGQSGWLHQRDARPWVLGDGPWDAPPGVGFGRQIAKGDRLGHVLSHGDHGSLALPSRVESMGGSLPMLSLLFRGVESRARRRR